MIRYANLVEQAVQLAYAGVDLLGKIARVHVSYAGSRMASRGSRYRGKERRGRAIGQIQLPAVFGMSRDLGLVMFSLGVAQRDGSRAGKSGLFTSKSKLPGVVASGAGMSERNTAKHAIGGEARHSPSRGRRLGEVGGRKEKFTVIWRCSERRSRPALYMQCSAQVPHYLLAHNGDNVYRAPLH